MAKLFEYGEVESVCSDPDTRQAALKISAPWCVVQAAIPILLGHGFIDLLRVKDPLVAWTPTIPRELFSDASLAEAPNIPDKVSMVVRERTLEMLNLFSDLASVLKNPDAAIGLLPMSVYVTFQFRSTFESLSEVIRKLEPFGTPGVAEFRYALASVLAEFLTEVGNVRPLELDVNGEPSILGIASALDASKMTNSTPSTQGQDLGGKH